MCTLLGSRPVADTLSPRPPFELLAASSAFCLAATTASPTAMGGANASSLCESVQYVSGLALDVAAAPHEDPSLLLSYGINDCSAALGELPMRRVWQMLLPLGNHTEACVRAHNDTM